MKQRDEIPWHLKFYCKEDGNKYNLLKQKIQFREQKQDLNICHQFYVKKSEVKEKKIRYKMLLTHNNEDRKEENVFKYVGECELQLGTYLIENEYPVVMQFILPIKKCKDSEAYIKLSMSIRELQQFISFFNIKDSLQQKTKSMNSEQQMTEKYIDEQFNRQDLQQSKSQLQKLQSRTLLYQQQIKHLKQENTDLNKQINQRKQAINISAQIQEDKLDLLIRKNIKVEKQFIKAKQDISDIVNLINQYGRLDIVEDITNLLAS